MGKRLMIEAFPPKREHANDIVNAVLGPPGSLGWSLLPTPNASGWIETAGIPGEGDLSNVIAYIVMDSHAELSPDALKILRDRAQACAQKRGLSITAMRVES